MKDAVMLYAHKNWPVKIGCIADDATGAADLASSLVNAGMRVVQTVGVPSQPPESPVDAVVVALKTRSLRVAEAVQQSLQALHWLKAQGVQQIYFKYCSTFDSTDKGNIGPVAEALMDSLGTDFTVATPALPQRRRKVFMGYLFVDGVLLHESGMQDHPLTPMTDSNLVRVLQAQTRRKVGLIEHSVVARGEAAVRAHMAALKAQGVGIAIVDALSDADLLRLGPALKGMPLVTAGSGLAMAVARNFGLRPGCRPAALPAATGLQAIISGSCSRATQQQVLHFLQTGGPAMALDVLRMADGEPVAQQALDWARNHMVAGTPVLLYSTLEAAALQAVHQQLGAAQASALVESCMATVALGLVEQGLGQLVVAGGETSGACVQALQIEHMRIGSQIEPGVPWCHAVSPVLPQGLHITLKSGNFGAQDFFTQAFATLAKAPRQ